MKQLLLLMAVIVFGCSKAELPLIPPQSTILNVTAIDENGSNVDSASVFLDGTAVGLTPFNAQDVQPGLHALRVTRNGFRVFSDQILVEEGKSYNVEALLASIPPELGQMVVTVNLDSASIRVLDHARNIVAESRERASVHVLSPGIYTVIASSEFCPSTQKEAEVISGKTITVSLELEIPAISPTLTFSILEDTVRLGEPINLSWESDGLQVIIDQGIGARGPRGTDQHMCNTAGKKIFTATAYSADDLTTQISDSVVIQVERAVAPTLEFAVQEDTVEFGETVQLTWESNGLSVVLDHGIGSRGPSGSEELKFSNPGMKIVTATSYSDGSLRTIKKDSVFVKEAPLPEHPVVLLSATRLATVNTPATITWSSQNADYIVVDYVDSPEIEGSAEVVFSTPGIRIVTATAFNQRGYISASDTIEVVEPEVVSVDDILVAAQSSVRADQGVAGMTDLSAAAFEVETAGTYQVFAEVWYNSGDSQINESYFIDIADALGNTILPRDGNAGNNKVVPDEPGEPHTSSRGSGIFKLEAGSHTINIYHYAMISEMYPQFLYGEIDGPESVKILGFRIVYVTE